MGVLKKLSGWYFSKRKLPYWIVLLIDCAIVAFSGYVAYYIQFGGANLASNFWRITLGLVLTVFLFVLSFAIFHTFRGLLRYSSFVDLEHVALAALVGSAFTLLVSFAFDFAGADWAIMPNYRSCIIIFAGTTLLMWVERVLIKSLYDQFRSTDFSKRTLIYGVRAGAVGLAKEIRNQSEVEYTLCGFISPDPQDKTEFLMGLKVYPDNDALDEVLVKQKIEVVIVSPLQINHFRERTSLVDTLIADGIHIKAVPGIEDWDGTSEIHATQLHEVDIEDLLPREKIEISTTEIRSILKGRRILITGAAGSIGSEIVRQVAPFSPSDLILVDQAETPMHDVRMYMAKQFPDITCETIVASITDEEYMERIFEEFRPEYVFHAAAYKHVPMMEDNPAEAVLNNVQGTRIIADLAVKYGVGKFVMISTDKAVNPSNVMGCSKRICEIYCQSLSRAVEQGKAPAQFDGKSAVTQFVTTRFGNVLGSNGSVIPLFRQQIAAGGPVTVTDPEIVRYFMLIPEACKLVLEAAAIGHGGEIFVFDMGSPVRISDLAKRMIRLSGAKNVEVKYTGLREGEKLYEEVLSDKEKTQPTSNPKIRVALVREYDFQNACKNEKELLEVSRTFDDMAIVAKMKEIVPEFRSLNSRYSVLDKQ